MRSIFVPRRCWPNLPATARVAQDLNALIKISTTINSIGGLAELQKELLRLVIEVIPAEIAA